MSAQVSNRQMKEFEEMAREVLTRLDGDFSIFIADWKFTESYDSEGNRIEVITPYMYVKR